MTNEWQIRDDAGVIESGTEEEMRAVWEKILNRQYPEDGTEIAREGDVVLVEVHATHR